MVMNVTGAAASANAAHVRHSNFGALNSAIMRGDLEAAQTAFTALSAASPKAANPTASLDAVGQAIVAGDIDAVRKALAEYRTGRGMKNDAPAPTTPDPAQPPSDGTSTISLLA